MDTISEREFKQLCEDVYRERDEIAGLLPNVSPREALLWMLLGSLVALLSVPEAEQAEVVEAASQDPYGEAIIKVLQARRAPVFDPKIYLAELSAKLESEL